MNLAMTSLEEAWGSNSINTKPVENKYKSNNYQKQFLKKSTHERTGPTAYDTNRNQYYQLQNTNDAIEHYKSSLNLTITDSLILRYLQKFTDSYKVHHITNIIKAYISKHKQDKMEKFTTSGNDETLMYLMIMLIGILLIDKFYKK